MKICTKCDESKGLECFTTKSGNVTSRCKRCLAENNMKWARNNPDKIKIIRKVHYQENKEACNQVNKQWIQENPERAKEIKQRSRKLHADKHKARAKVEYAVKSGKLTKPELCSRCEKESMVEAHHDNYKKPLDVVWVCRNCHYEIHMELKENPPQGVHRND